MYISIHIYAMCFAPILLNCRFPDDHVVRDPHARLQSLLKARFLSCQDGQVVSTLAAHCYVPKVVSLNPDRAPIWWVSLCFIIYPIPSLWASVCQPESYFNVCVYMYTFVYVSWINLFTSTVYFSIILLAYFQYLYNNDLFFLSLKSHCLCFVDSD